MLTPICQVQQCEPITAVVEDPTLPVRRHDARTLVLLEAPIAPTLIKLAAPNILVNNAGFAAWKPLRRPAWRSEQARLGSLTPTWSRSTSPIWNSLGPASSSP
jgi:hypothetical protein